MSFEDDSLGAISIYDVEAKEKSRRLKFKRRVKFDQKIQKERTHKPLNLRLQINHGRRYVGDRLKGGKTIDDGG